MLDPLALVNRVIDPLVIKPDIAGFPAVKGPCLRDQRREVRVRQ